MNLLIPVKIFFQVACLQKLHRTQQSGKVADSSKAGIEKDRDKIRKNGIIAGGDNWAKKCQNGRRSSLFSQLQPQIHKP